MKRLKLLFVHEVNYLKKVVYEMHEYPERLAARGHQIVFVDFPEGSERRGIRRFLDLHTEVRPGVARTAIGSTIELRTPGRVFAPPLDRLCATLTHFPVIRRAMTREAFDAIVLYAIPTNGWQTVSLANRLGIPLIFRAIDVPTEMRKTVFRPLVHYAAKYVYRHADRISTHTGPLRDYCVAMGARPENVSIEYPGFNLEHFIPGPRDADLARSVGISPTDRVIVFMGEFHHFSAVDWLVTAFAPTLRRDRNIQLLLIGDKPAKGGLSAADVREVAEDAGVSAWVKAVGRIGHADLPRYLRLADIAVVPLRGTTQANTAFPSKAIQYLACGLPTVCTRLAGMRSVVPREEMGILYRDLDESFVATNVTLLGDADRRLSLAAAARCTAETLFSWDRCVAEFESAIAKTIQARGRKEEL